MASSGTQAVFVAKDERIAAYGFGEGHPFGLDRHAAFHNELARAGLGGGIEFVPARTASREELLAFHTPRYVDFVAEACNAEGMFLDGGDTPAFPGLYEAAADVAGTTLALVDLIMGGGAGRAFTPIGGLHHAGRDHAAGFCVFNDCGIAAEILRARHGLKRIAYVDIDAHHGDGMYYAFAADPDIYIADIHEDGRALFPGTGHRNEIGTGAAEGTKLNIPLRPRMGDEKFLQVWEDVEVFIENAQPEFILFQCGADSIAGDPITHLEFTPAAHAHAARRLCALADKHCDGRILGMGGGGYNRDNLARGWTAVVQEFVRAN
ncbi:MAG: acetoin utilization protein AcuC [Gammaproteobacteria bacterium]|jgi:acetoin utilization protein AcuC|nr:acetoin utilization protein AcuC [Gammaproteobacteria bacterium]MDP6616357.1 acetoin utilization protein AcuC [Gammaproteobacteria bacterium]MDP6695887.1 acetoin utilization protein AcuC [Gammaproteobacteria bacterium]